DRSRQGAGAKHDRQVPRRLEIEASRDRRVTARDALTDHRGRAHLSIEHDRELPSDVVAGDARELTSTPWSHGHAHAPAAGIRLIEPDARFRAGNRATGHLGLALRDVEHA